MNNNKKIIIIVSISLVVLIMVHILTLGEQAEKNEMNKDAVFQIYRDKKLVKTYDFEMIRNLGEETFIARHDSSDTLPKDYNYTGVLLKKIINDSGVSLKDDSRVIVSAVDGYAVMLDMEKINDPENVFLSYKQEKEYFKARSEGGIGPYQLIIRKDQFSQYWVKYAVKVVIESD